MIDIYEQFSKELAARIEARGFGECVVLAELAADTLREQFGGMQVYLPGLSKNCRDKRDVAIRKEFNGNNLDEIMKRHDCSKATVYRALIRKTRRRRG